MAPDFIGFRPAASMRRAMRARPSTHARRLRLLRRRRGRRPQRVTALGRLLRARARRADVVVGFLARGITAPPPPAEAPLQSFAAREADYYKARPYRAPSCRSMAPSARLLPGAPRRGRLSADAAPPATASHRAGTPSDADAEPLPAPLLDLLPMMMISPTCARDFRLFRLSPGREF